MFETIRLPYPVPYAAQIASPDLAQAIFGEGMDPGLDPRWREVGAATPQEYAYWVDRACGAACVKMVAEASGGPPRPLMDYIQAGLARNGYLVDKVERSRVVERGWLHRALAEVIREAGCPAEPQPATLDEIAATLRAGRMVIASVSYQLGTGGTITHRGGHLVVVIGMDLDQKTPTNIYLHNPSGRTPALRENACIPAGRFAEAYTGRIIVAGRP